MVDYQMYIGMMVISNWKACNCQKDGNNAHDSCAMCGRCFDIATKFKRHVNTQHIKNFMSMQSANFLLVMIRKGVSFIYEQAVFGGFNGYYC